MNLNEFVGFPVAGDLLRLVSGELSLVQRRLQFVFRIFFCHNFLAVSLGSVLNFDTPVQFNIGSVWFSFWFFPTPNPEPVYLILSVYTSKFEVQPWLSCSLQLHFPPSSTTLHILTHFAISQVILLNSFIKLLPLLLLL